MRKFVRYLFSAHILCTFNRHTLKTRCTSMTHAFIFLYLVQINAVICIGYYGAANQTRFAWTVIYCTDLLHLTAYNLHTIRHKSSVWHRRTSRLKCMSVECTQNLSRKKDILQIYAILTRCFDIYICQIYFKRWI